MTRMTRSFSLLPTALVLFLTCALWPSASPAAVDGLLRVHPENPRYLTNDAGDPILLIGPHTWHVFQDYDDGKKADKLDYEAWLDELDNEGFTFFRGWTWSDGYYSPLPFEQVIVQGRLVYDLTRWNPRYFRRLRSRIRAAGEHGLYTSVLLFQEWSVDDFEGRRRPDPWAVHPFNKSNNVQGIRVRDHSGGKLRAIHDEYLERMVDELYGLDNFVWEVGNELHGNAGQWVRLVVARLRELEDAKVAADPKRLDRRHLVWASCIGGRSMPGPAFGADLVSPCSTEGYGVETANSCFDVARNASPPAATGSRIVIVDSDHLAPMAANPDWAWKSFFRGLHPIILTVPEGDRSLPWWRGNCDLDRGRRQTERLQETLRTIARIARKTDLAGSVPQRKTEPGHPETVSTSNYALFTTRDPSAAGLPNGRRFLVYQPAAVANRKPVTVCGLRRGRTYRVIWRRLDTGEVFWRDRRTSVNACESFNGSPEGGVLALELK